MSGTMSVRHLEGDRFAVDVRGHTVVVDQPEAMGGADSAPTPTELFIASLAACVGFYARRFLVRHDLPVEGLGVRTSYDLGAKPSRVESISVELIVPAGVPADMHERLLAVASHCTVHNSLTTTPEIAVALAPTEIAA